MKVIKDREKIVLKEEDKIIEEYEQGKEITFRKFFNHLLSLDLAKSIEIVIENYEELNDEDKALVDLIKQVKDDYNKKVEEYSVFKRSK